MKRMFKDLKPGDTIWQVLKTKSNTWEVTPKLVTEIQWPYRRATGKYHFMKLTGNRPGGVGCSTTYIDDPEWVAINGPFGFVLSANTDQSKDFYTDKSDAENACLKHLYEALERIDEERKRITNEIEKFGKCSDKL